jgi:hypothetical protein
MKSLHNKYLEMIYNTYKKIFLKPIITESLEHEILNQLLKYGCVTAEGVRKKPINGTISLCKIETKYKIHFSTIIALVNFNGEMINTNPPNTDLDIITKYWGNFSPSDEDMKKYGTLKYTGRQISYAIELLSANRDVIDEYNSVN